MRDVARRTVKKILSGAGIDHRRLGRIRWVTKIRRLRDSNAAVRHNFGYVLASAEIDNFAYDISNEDELAGWVADLLGVERPRVAEIILEARSHPWLIDLPPLGRRLGWYALTRLLRPDRIVETGIHKGLGSRTFLAALDRNAHGELVSFDTWRGAGELVGRHPRWSRRIIGSEEGLAPAFSESRVQLFLHDSLHTYEHEKLELGIAAEAMREGVLLSDNSYETTALRDLCTHRGWRYRYFHEHPRGHFFRGAGVGAGVVS